MKKVLWGIAILACLSGCADNSSSQKEGSAKAVNTNKTQATVKETISSKSITAMPTPTPAKSKTSTSTPPPNANKAAKEVDFKQLEQVSNEAHKGIENLQKQKRAVEKTVDELLKEFE